MKLNFPRTIFVLLLAFPVFAQTAPAPKPIDLLKKKLEQIGAGVSAAAGCLTQRSV